MSRDEGFYFERNVRELTKHNLVKKQLKKSPSNKFEVPVTTIDKAYQNKTIKERSVMHSTN